MGYISDWIGLTKVERKVDRILEMLDTGQKMLSQSKKREEQTMVSQEEIKQKIADTLVEVAACGTRLDSIDTLMDGYRQTILDLMAAAGASQEIMDGVSAVFDEAKKVTAKADAAITENTPVPPPPIP
jgi:peroxiredoxin family protein